MTDPTASPRATRAGYMMDLTAGTTVALVSLPQCLAYAMMSGLPPEYGLVTAAVPGLVAALAGRSAQIITGPTNTTGLLILKALGPFLLVNGLLGPEGLPVLATLTLLAGAIRLIVAVAGGATLLRFIPESVLVGFTAGAGTLIGIMQLDEALGLPPARGSSMIAALGEVWAHLASVSWQALGLALAVAGAIRAGKRWAPNAPVALLTIVGATLAAWLLDWSRAMGIPTVRDRSPLPSGWPELAMPTLQWSAIEPLLLPAVAIVLLGTLELTVSVRAEDGEQDMRREIMAQGWANIAGAFTGAFPASASLTRSALLRLGGAQTRLAAASAALIMFPTLLFASKAVGYIPQPALAGVLWVTALSMIRVDRMRRIWACAPTSRGLLFITYAATLLLPLELAIFLGVGLGLLVHLKESGAARTRYFLATSADPLAPRQPLDPTAPADPDVNVDADAHLIIEISGNFHYAAVQHFRETEADRIPTSPARVIIDLEHAHHARFAAVQLLEHLDATLSARGQQLRLRGVSERFAEILARTGSALASPPGPLSPGCGEGGA